MSKRSVLAFLALTFSLFAFAETHTTPPSVVAYEVGFSPGGTAVKATIPLSKVAA